MIALRMAHPQDAPEILSIYRYYVEHTSITFETTVPTPEEFATRIQEAVNFFPYLVATEDGRIVGYAYAHEFHPRQAYRWTVETSIYIAQEHRGQHIGKQLYTELLGLLTAQGFQNVCAVVTIPNAPSMAFHTSLGFETGNLLPNFGYKLGSWHGVAYLYRSLGKHPEHPPEPVSVWNLPKSVVKNLTKS